jgi:hypothetical protein
MSSGMGVRSTKAFCWNLVDVQYFAIIVGVNTYLGSLRAILKVTDELFAYDCNHYTVVGQRRLKLWRALALMRSVG